MSWFTFFLGVLGIAAVFTAGVISGLIIADKVCEKSIKKHRGDK